MANNKRPLQPESVRQCATVLHSKNGEWDVAPLVYFGGFRRWVLGWIFVHSQLRFDILKMCETFQSLWVLKLIGKPRVPYNLGLRVRGSSHPILKCDYEPFLSPFAATSKVFRIHSDLPCPAWRIASFTCRASGGVSGRRPLRPSHYSCQFSVCLRVFFIINVIQIC